MQKAQTPPTPARQELERLANEGEQIGGRALPEASDDAPPDRVEIWGRRIGRALGWTAAAFLLLQLFRTYAG